MLLNCDQMTGSIRLRCSRLKTIEQASAAEMSGPQAAIDADERGDARWKGVKAVAGYMLFLLNDNVGARVNEAR
jgi:hypothetical protein